MSSVVKLSGLLVLLGVAACSQPEPAPVVVIEPEPVYTGKY